MSAYQITALIIRLTRYLSTFPLRDPLKPRKKYMSSCLFLWIWTGYAWRTVTISNSFEYLVAFGSDSGHCPLLA